VHPVPPFLSRLVAFWDLEERTLSLSFLAARGDLRAALGGGRGRIVLQTGPICDARRPESALGTAGFRSQVSLYSRQSGAYGGSLACALGGAVRVRPEAAPRATAGRVPGDRPLGVPFEAVLAGPAYPPDSVRAEDFVPLATVEHSYPYPSGHALRSTIFLGIAYLLIRNAFLRARIALLLVGLLASRVYLGVHWVSDVVGGALLGAAVVWAFGQESRGWR
jgi:PAP2 superfamily protein